MVDRTPSGAVEAARLSDPELAFESINVALALFDGKFLRPASRF
jgi:hypothetical protein